MPLPAWIAGLFEPITKLIDEVHFSGEEKAELQAKFKLAVLESQATTAEKIAEYEIKLIDAQKSIIIAEAQGESWMQRNWRPLTMLVFVFIIAWNYIISPLLFWVSNSHAPQLEIPEGMWTLLQIGIGGYVGLRSVEKMVDSVTKSDNISLNIGSKKKVED